MNTNTLTKPRTSDDTIAPEESNRSSNWRWASTRSSFNRSATTVECSGYDEFR